MKTGWWKIRFDVMLDGIEIDFDELPDAEKRRIQKLLASGVVAGELQVGESRKMAETLTI